MASPIDLAGLFNQIVPIMVLVLVIVLVISLFKSIFGAIRGSTRRFPSIVARIRR